MIKTCKNCGKKAHKVTNVIYNMNGKYDYLFDANFEYLGNDILVSKNIRTYENIGKHVSSFSTWDGQSYTLKYDNFCTLRCATQFANNIVNFRGQK
mgnify:FL=1